MNMKRVRSVAAIVVLVLTVAVFTVYFIQHPRTFSALSSVPLPTIVLLFGLYALFIGTLVWIQRATLRLCNITLGRKESALVVMYSSVINFFGPLQSGPAFRAAYLKSRHNLNLKKYGLATLLYYGFYALFSGLLLLSFIFGWWVAVVGVLAFVATPLIVLIPRFRGLDLGASRQLGLATLAQAVVQSAIYYTELHSLMPHVTYVQSLIYTGAANFALFVSLTPGAIGFRESFLLATQRLHDISNATIATASVIDRSVYIVLLIVLALIIFGLHADTFLKAKKPAK